MQFQDAARHAQARVGRDHIDVIWLHAQIVRHLEHRHYGGPGQDLRQCAGVLRIEVLNQHKTQAGVDWQPFQQLREGIQAARRRADADDRKIPAGSGIRTG